MALTALAAGLIGSALGSALSAGVSARNTDVQQQTSYATAPITNGISGNFGAAQSVSDSSGGSFQQGWSEGYTAGKEASEADIIRAREANETQKEMMQMQMDYNRAEAKLAREWSENMSNTAYQRAVADLKAAGLSPILAAGNLGASTPTASFASSGLGTAQKAQTFADQYSKSGSSGGSSQSSHSRSNEVTMGGSKNNSRPAYLEASGSVAQALANNLNVSSAQALQNQAIIAGMGVG